MSFNNMDIDKRKRKIEDSITFLKTVMNDFYTNWGLPELLTAIQIIFPEIEARHNEKNPEIEIEVGSFKK